MFENIATFFFGTPRRAGYSIIAFLVLCALVYIKTNPEFLPEFGNSIARSVMGFVKPLITPLLTIGIVCLALRWMVTGKKPTKK
jgi:hypothetical protein